MKKNSSSDLNIIHLDSFQRKDDDKDFFKEIERIKTENNERRLSLHHFITHLLAIIIIFPYLIFISFRLEIPQSYSTIVSVVIGFYFAKSLFKEQ